MREEKLAGSRRKPGTVTREGIGGDCDIKLAKPSR